LSFIFRSKIKILAKGSNVKIFDSKILNASEYHKKLIDLCEFDVETKWNLLYRASEHGFTAQDFHSKCDNHANTLAIIKSTNGNIFGGYTQQLWTIIDGGGFKEDKNAFLFSLINNHGQPMKMKIKKPKKAIFCYKNWGLSFCHGFCDLRISDNSDINSSSSCTDFGQTYEHPVYAHGSKEAKSFLAGSENFQTSEIEVFKQV
jgi:hypothetical protein